MNRLAVSQLTAHCLAIGFTVHVMVTMVVALIALS